MVSYCTPHICQCLTRLSTLRRNSLVTISAHRRKTGHQFVQCVLRLGAALIELGLQNGQYVAISAFNSDWYLEWLLAVALVGGIVAPLNYRWSFEEAKSAMLLLKPVMLVTDDSCKHWSLDLLTTAVPSLKWLVAMDSSSSFDFVKPTSISSFQSFSIEELSNLYTSSLPLNYSWAPEGVALVCFTSGTTGRPKGVVIPHSALIVQSLAKVALAGYHEDDVYVHTAPLCHIGGLSSALAMLMVGACHILIPKFDAKAVVDAIEQHHATSLITVPAMMADLISVVRVKAKKMPSVTRILNGGGSLPISLVKDAANFFPRAKLLSAYGMTETCSSLTFLMLHNPKLETTEQSQKITGRTTGICVGKPAPHVELKIFGDGSSDNIGKIVTRGPHLMLRYLDETTKMVDDSTSKGWFDTGDVGTIDSCGYVWLMGRKNNRIKSGGENVHPEEVEAILSEHGGVIGSVVVGIPEARLTEMVVGCIKLKEKWKWRKHDEEVVFEEKLTLSSKILGEYCKEKGLTGFKIPKRFILWRRTEFPCTTTGKVKREQVRREVMSHWHCLSSSSNL